jgi:hypothetical protein
MQRSVFGASRGRFRAKKKERKKFESGSARSTSTARK